MDERRGPNPFVPGWGRTPPYLAGRSDEQRKLLDLFAYLEHGEGAPRGAILSGPRGNGKTALLRWFHREIDSRDTPCDVVWLTPNEIADLDQLATSLVPPSRFTALRPDTLSFSVGIGRLGWELAGQQPLSDAAAGGALQAQASRVAAGRSAHAAAASRTSAVERQSNHVCGSTVPIGHGGYARPAKTP